MFDPKTKVMIVDDMNTMRKIVKMACTQIGFSNVVDAVDGERAWEALKASTDPVGLIISDWNMPNCTGIDLLKRVRADEKLRKIPFLMLTAENEQGQMQQAFDAGIDGYLIKPVTPDMLATKLEEVYKAAKSRR